VLLTPQEVEAVNFARWDCLNDGLRNLLRNFWGGDDAVMPALWDGFAAEQDGRAAACLAISNALSRVAVHGCAPARTALDMLESLVEIRSDRLLVRLHRASFEQWFRGGAHFTIFLANGMKETSAVQFNRGDAWGSLHTGYTLQGYTAALRVPRVHWNYREGDSAADIDLDGYPPTTWEHLTDRNSDARCWQAAYVAKFGYPGFEVTSRKRPPHVVTLRS
jgi:hypothetical protein